MNTNVNKDFEFFKCIRIRNLLLITFHVKLCDYNSEDDLDKLFIY